MYLPFKPLFFVFCLFFIGPCCAVFGQTQQKALAKNEFLDSLFTKDRYIPQRYASVERILKNKYAESKDSEYLVFSKFMALWYKTIKDPELLDELKIKIVKEYTEFPNTQALFYNEVAYINFIAEKNFEKAFDAYVSLEELLHLYSPKIIPRYSYYCSQIASAYYRFKDYKRAIYYGNKGLAYAGDKWDLYNTIGLCYTELNQLDSSNLYLQKAISEAKKLKLNPIYVGISSGNIGFNYYVKKEYEQALPLIQKDFKEATAYHDWGLAAGSSILISHIFLEQGKLNQADTMLKLARKYIQVSSQINRLEKYYPIRSLYYEKLGQLKTALAYRDSAMKAYKYNDSAYNGLLVLRVQQRADLTKIEKEKIKLENYRDAIKNRFIVLGLIVTLLGIGYYWYRNYLNRLQRNKEKIAELNRILDLRQRLSADMHDDIGSSLSSISLYIHSLLLQSRDVQQINILEKIRDNAQHIQDQMSDIIWSVNPKMDKMAELVARMRKFGADITEPIGIAFEFSASSEITHLNIEMSLRRHLYLMIKEAINNAAKYSNAKKITVRMSLNQQRLSICIEDNGIGFNIDASVGGNGLTNLKNRAQTIQAQLEINSAIGRGTAICIHLNILANWPIE